MLNQNSKDIKDGWSSEDISLRPFEAAKTPEITQVSSPRGR
jgi:hypothetical protein